MTPAPRPRPQHLFSNVSPLEESHAHVTFVQETPEVLDFSRDMFESSLTGSPEHVPDTPVEAPIPPPMPKSRTAQFVETFPITPVRLQGQRWRNWATTRLSHLPPNELYIDD